MTSQRKKKKEEGVVVLISKNKREEDGDKVSQQSSVKMTNIIDISTVLCKFHSHVPKIMRGVRSDGEVKAMESIHIIRGLLSGGTRSLTSTCFSSLVMLSRQRTWYLNNITHLICTCIKYYYFYVLPVLHTHLLFLVMLSLQRTCYFMYFWC